MRMADVAAIFGTLLALGIAFPGLLTTLWLLFPKSVERAKTRLELHPFRCFWAGLFVGGVVGLPALALLNVPGLGQFMGAVLIILALTFSAIGAAGMVVRLAERFETLSQTRMVGAGSFVCAAVALELGAIFPVLGWFVVMPLLIIMSLGASVLSLSRRRLKFDRTDPAPALGSTVLQQV